MAKKLRVLKNKHKRVQFKTPIASDMFLPNHSGLHKNPKSSQLSIHYGQRIIEITDLEAFLVRQEGDQGDIFLIDTFSPFIRAFTGFIIDTDREEAFLVRKQGDAGDVFNVKTTDGESGVKANGLNLNLVTKTTTYTALSSDDTIICDATSGAFTINLPSATNNTGKIYNIKKIDSSVNSITIDGNSSETIDDQTTQQLSSQYDCITIQSDGTEWWII